MQKQQCLIAMTSAALLASNHWPRRRPKVRPTATAFTSSRLIGTKTAQCMAHITTTASRSRQRIAVIAHEKSSGRNG